jgi:glycosyltransferase involved in cell wall biosynthesis
MAYNHSNFIGAAIDSILEQDYRYIEIVISDDDSTDNTLEVIQGYLDKYPDKIKLLTTTENLGATENWFKCICACNGKYIIGLGGDDEFYPNMLSKQIAIMENDPDIAICYADASVFHVPTQIELYHLSDKAPTKSGDIIVALQDAIYYSPTSMFRRSLIPEENSFIGIRHGSDLAFYKELMIRSAPNGKIYYLPKILYKYQKHLSNITVTEDSYRKEHINCIKILQSKYPKYQKFLNPSIYDFCCVAFFKSLYKFKFKNAFYFLFIGLKASKGNPFKFFRSVVWAIKWFCRFY